MNKFKNTLTVKYYKRNIALFKKESIKGFSFVLESDIIFFHLKPSLLNIELFNFYNVKNDKVQEILDKYNEKHNTDISYLSELSCVDEILDFCTKYFLQVFNGKADSFLDMQDLAIEVSNMVEKCLLDMQKEA